LKGDQEYIKKSKEKNRNFKEILTRKFVNEFFAEDWQCQALSQLMFLRFSLYYKKMPNHFCSHTRKEVDFWLGK